jgi:hypothetical protein
VFGGGMALNRMMTARGQVLCREISEATGRPVGGPKIVDLINGNSSADSEQDEPDDA